MRSLFITRRFLGDGEAPVTGSYQRMRMFLEAVSRLSSHLDLLVFVPPDLPVTEEVLAQYRPGYGESVQCPFTLHFVPRERERPRAGGLAVLHRPWSLFSPAVHRYYAMAGPVQVRAVADLLAQAPDLVFINRLNAIAPLLRGALRHKALFLGLDDVEHTLFIRSMLAPPRYPGKLAGLLHAGALLWGERRALQMALRTYVCSAEDRGQLRRVNRAARIEVVPNAAAIPPASPVPAAPTLLFLGSAIYSPNQVAADWLAAEVWPRVRAAVPGAELILAGQFPERLAAYAAPPPGVGFTGFVEDLDALYRRVRVVTCPIQSGSGTRIKIIEAGAYGRPVVSTRVGAEGLALVDGESVLLRDDPAGFADACIRVLQDDVLAARLGAAIRGVAETEYDRRAVIARIQADMAGAMGESSMRLSGTA